MPLEATIPEAQFRPIYNLKVQVQIVFELWVRVAFWPEPGTIGGYMGDVAENCLHLEGLRATLGSEFQCPVCKVSLDLEGVERWVRAAERTRDEVYSMVEGDEFAGIVREERQREVYRRRKVLYELRSIPRAVVARPEMILVSYVVAEDAYECKIFYKEPRPAWGLERISVEAALEPILALRSHPDPNVRLVSDKAEEFHILRLRLAEQNAPSPLRRVYYQNEF
jgi:hypothetical protein